MRYLPYGPLLNGVRHAVAGGAPRPDTTLTLSGLPGVRLPAELRADTAAEIVLNLLRSSRHAALLNDIEVVSCDEFHADGLLSIWSLLHPAEAVARLAKVEEAARAGLFAASVSSEARQFACWVNSVAEEHPGAPEQAYQAALPLVESVLDQPRDHDLAWIGEYSDIIKDEAMLHSGAVEIENYPELDLAVLTTPLRLHDTVRFSATSMFRVLTVRSENTFTLEYRLESWLQYASRRPLPRLDLQPLAARLNLFEQRPGQWRADPIQDRTPRLLLDTGDGRPAPSSLAAETVIAETLEYFRRHARDAALHWSPYPGGAAA